MALNKTKLFRTVKDDLFIAFGMALYAFGFCGFILPEKVVIGGLAGISSIVYFTLGIPVAITNYALNLFLLAFAYRIVGKHFVIGTIFGATMISLFIGIFQPLLCKISSFNLSDKISTDLFADTSFQISPQRSRSGQREVWSNILRDVP